MPSTAVGPDGKTVRFKLSDFKGKKNVVLAFFPAAFSPGCTSEMAKYQETSGQFNTNNTVILGMSVDSTWANAAFADKLGVKFNILSDNQLACNCGSTVSSQLQEVGGGYRFEPNRFIQGTYNAPLTSKLLVEAGVGASISQWNAFWQPGVQARSSAQLAARLCLRCLHERSLLQETPLSMPRTALLRSAARSPAELSSSRLATAPSTWML